MFILRDELNSSLTLTQTQIHLQRPSFEVKQFQPWHCCDTSNTFCNEGLSVPAPSTDLGCHNSPGRLQLPLQQC